MLRETVLLAELGGEEGLWVRMGPCFSHIIYTAASEFGIEMDLKLGLQEVYSDSFCFVIS